MKLTYYDIIKGPVISEKAYKLNRTQNQLVLWVHIDANRPMIKQAIEKLFDVKVDDVRTVIHKKSQNKASQKKYDASSKIEKKKKAYITLAEGHRLNFFDQAGTGHAEESKPSKADS